MEICYICKRAFKPDAIKLAVRAITWPNCPLRCTHCSTLRWKQFQQKFAGMRANLEREDM